jgi:hypothetical protein
MPRVDPPRIGRGPSWNWGRLSKQLGSTVGWYPLDSRKSQARSRRCGQIAPNDDEGAMIAMPSPFLRRGGQIAAITVSERMGSVRQVDKRPRSVACLTCLNFCFPRLAKRLNTRCHYAGIAARLLTGSAPEHDLLPQRSPLRGPFFPSIALQTPRPPSFPHGCRSCRRWCTFHIPYVLD